MAFFWRIRAFFRENVSYGLRTLSWYVTLIEDTKLVFSLKKTNEPLCSTVKSKAQKGALKAQLVRTLLYIAFGNASVLWVRRATSLLEFQR